MLFVSSSSRLYDERNDKPKNASAVAGSYTTKRTSLMIDGGWVVRNLITSSKKIFETSERGKSKFPVPIAGIAMDVNLSFLSCSKHLWTIRRRVLNKKIGRR